MRATQYKRIERMLKADAIVAKLAPMERDVFSALVEAFDQKDHGMVDGVVCMYFVQQGLMRVAPDGFVISDLGREVSTLLQKERGS